MFYHPATWWLSARIREERELVCDEEIALRCGPLPYAHALAAAAEWRIPALAAGATSGSLLDRIERLFGVGARRRRPRWMAPAVAAALALGLVSGTGAVAEPADGLEPLPGASASLFAWPASGGEPSPGRRARPVDPRPEASPSPASPEPVPDLAVVAAAPAPVDDEVGSPSSPDPNAGPCLNLYESPLSLRWCGTDEELAAVRAWKPEFVALAAEADVGSPTIASGWRTGSGTASSSTPSRRSPSTRPPTPVARIERRLRAYERAVGAWLARLDASAPPISRTLEAALATATDCYVGYPPVRPGYLAMRTGCGWQLVPDRLWEPAARHRVLRASAARCPVERAPALPAGRCADPRPGAGAPPGQGRADPEADHGEVAQVQGFRRSSSRRISARSRRYDTSSSAGTSAAATQPSSPSRCRQSR